MCGEIDQERCETPPPPSSSPSRWACGERSFYIVFTGICETSLFFLLLFTVLGEHGSPSACYLQYSVSVRFISVAIYSTWWHWMHLLLLFITLGAHDITFCCYSQQFVCFLAFLKVLQNVIMIVNHNQMRYFQKCTPCQKAYNLLHITAKPCSNVAKCCK